MYLTYPFTGVSSKSISVDASEAKPPGLGVHEISANAMVNRIKMFNTFRMQEPIALYISELNEVVPRTPLKSWVAQEL